MFNFSRRFLSHHISPQYGDKGVYMRNWDTTDESGVCTSDQDWRDVQAVCKQLDIPCRHVDFTKEYWVKVFTKMVEDYENGFTPNPDIMCNREIKFGLFLDKCLEPMFNAKWFATASIVRDGVLILGDRTLCSSRAHSRKSIDSAKDQSYFLSTVPEERLKWAMFPVGKLYKTQVKSIASNANLITANKKESMGVCFIGKRKKFAEFLKQYLVTKPGDIKTVDGKIIEITHFYFHEALLPRIGLGICLLKKSMTEYEPVFNGCLVPDLEISPN
ncbi:14041_t:CDS:2 [Cetraspora pellucida]|uniref:14041_t:CDS:1 n=1 Tax=Cetraspora pellucida TaxID=1433469 RepID=A0A9N9CVN7_9GLOM|nr:14041_t:CDS:2 [Cetraspora pellucida]